MLVFEVESIQRDRYMIVAVVTAQVVLRRGRQKEEAVNDISAYSILKVFALVEPFRFRIDKKPDRPLRPSRAISSAR